jgi:hypothetical protein
VGEEGEESVVHRTLVVLDSYLLGLQLRLEAQELSLQLLLERPLLLLEVFEMLSMTLLERLGLGLHGKNRLLELVEPIVVGRRGGRGRRHRLGRRWGGG